VKQWCCGRHGTHRQEYANVTDAANEVAALEASHREAEEIRSAHAPDRERRELLERRTHRKQRRLQTLTGQQDRGT
jgi:hypothetical protein